MKQRPPVETLERFVKALQAAQNKGVVFELCSGCVFRPMRMNGLTYCYLTPLDVVWETFYQKPGEPRLLEDGSLCSAIGLPKDKWLKFWAACCKDPGHNPKMRAKILDELGLQEAKNDS